MSDRTYAEVVNVKDEHFGQVGFIGRWDHNCGDVHFEDGAIKNYSAWDLKRVEK
jgi:hypothetical protein